MIMSNRGTNNRVILKSINNARIPKFSVKHVHKYQNTYSMLNSPDQIGNNEENKSMVNTSYDESSVYPKRMKHSSLSHSNDYNIPKQMHQNDRYNQTQSTFHSNPSPSLNSVHKHHTSIPLIDNHIEILRNLKKLTEINSFKQQQLIFNLQTSTEEHVALIKQIEDLSDTSKSPPFKNKVNLKLHPDEVSNMSLKPIPHRQLDLDSTIKFKNPSKQRGNNISFNYESLLDKINVIKLNQIPTLKFNILQKDNQKMKNIIENINFDKVNRNLILKNERTLIPTKIEKIDIKPEYLEMNKTQNCNENELCNLQVSQINQIFEIIKIILLEFKEKNDTIHQIKQELQTAQDKLLQFDQNQYEHIHDVNILTTLKQKDQQIDEMKKIMEEQRRRMGALEKEVEEKEQIISKLKEEQQEQVKSAKDANEFMQELKLDNLRNLHEEDQAANHTYTSQELKQTKPKLDPKPQKRKLNPLPQALFQSTQQMFANSDHFYKAYFSLCDKSMRIDQDTLLEYWKIVKASDLLEDPEHDPLTFNQDPPRVNRVTKLFKYLTRDSKKEEFYVNNQNEFKFLTHFVENTFESLKNVEKSNLNVDSQVDIQEFMGQLKRQHIKVVNPFQAFHRLDINKEGTVKLDQVELLRCVQLLLSAPEVPQDLIVWLETHIYTSSQNTARLLYKDMTKFTSNKRLTKADFSNWFTRKTKGLKLSDQMKLANSMRAVFAAFDLDGSEFIEFDEFLASFWRLEAFFEGFQQFKQMDANGDGRISLKEFREASEDLAFPQWQPEEAEAKFRVFQKARDELDFDDYIHTYITNFKGPVTFTMKGQRQKQRTLAPLRKVPAVWASVEDMLADGNVRIKVRKSLEQEDKVHQEVMFEYFKVVAASDQLTDPACNLMTFKFQEDKVKQLSSLFEHLTRHYKRPENFNTRTDSEFKFVCFFVKDAVDALNVFRRMGKGGDAHLDIQEFMQQLRKEKIHLPNPQQTYYRLDLSKEGQVTLNEVERLRGVYLALDSSEVPQDLVVWLERHLVISAERTARKMQRDMAKFTSAHRLTKADFVNWFTRKITGLRHGDHMKITKSMRAVFSIFDVDNSATIEQEEFKDNFWRLEAFFEGYYQFRWLDSNNDGRVSFKEFKEHSSDLCLPGWFPMGAEERFKLFEAEKDEIVFDNQIMKQINSWSQNQIVQ